MTHTEICKLLLEAAHTRKQCSIERAAQHCVWHAGATLDWLALLACQEKYGPLLALLPQKVLDQIDFVSLGASVNAERYLYETSEGVLEYIDPFGD